MAQDLILLDQRYVLQQKPRQSLPFSVRRMGIAPQAREICGEHMQPGAQLFIDCQPIFLAFPFILLLRFLKSVMISKRRSPTAWSTGMPGTHWQTGCGLSMLRP